MICTEAFANTLFEIILLFLTLLFAVKIIKISQSIQDKQILKELDSLSNINSQWHLKREERKDRTKRYNFFLNGMFYLKVFQEISTVL